MSDSETYPADFQQTQSGTSRRIVVKKDKTNPRRVAYLALLLFATEPSMPLLVAGSIFALAGILFHGWAAGYLARAGYAERESVLTIRGPYRHNRNPYYVAHMVMDLGFFCMAGLPLLYLFYFPVIFSVYRRWVVKEEPFLEKEFGEDYRQFKAEVPRWGLRLIPATPRGPEQTFDWATFRLNREGHRALPHLTLGAVLLAFAFLGSPVAMVDPLVLATVFAAFVARLVIGDIRALNSSAVSPGWSLATLAVLTIGGIFLSIAPVWEHWPRVPSMVFGGSGALMGLIVAISLLPMQRPLLGRRMEKLLERPEYQWYFLGLGLGLLSGTLGGVWLGLLLPIALWMSKIAGLLSSFHLAKQRFTSSAVFLLFAISILMAAG